METTSVYVLNYQDMDTNELVGVFTSLEKAKHAAETVKAKTLSPGWSGEPDGPIWWSGGWAIERVVLDHVRGTP